MEDRVDFELSPMFSVCFPYTKVHVPISPQVLVPQGNCSKNAPDGLHFVLNRLD